mgnify:FL=1
MILALFESLLWSGGLVGLSLIIGYLLLKFGAF